MSETIILKKSIKKIGYISRTITNGSEYDMVNRYVEFIKNKYDNLKYKNAAIFIEPKLDSGYPDIVIVEYSSNTDVYWNNERMKLTITDYKILYHIQIVKYISIVKLSELLGFPESTIIKSISHLNSCKLVHISKSGKYVRNVKLKGYSKILNIISIEAKLDKWSEAIKQAERNIWFSTESYILMNKDFCNTSIINDCKSKGIGIILINGSIHFALKSQKRSFPVSYASLLFNEWLVKFEKVENQ